MKRQYTQRKAQIHVEMVISFTLFVGILFVFFLLLNPFSQEEKFVTLTKNIVLEELKGKVGKLSAIVNTENDCYSLSEVNDDYGDNFVEISDSQNSRRYFIYYSPMFVQRTISCEEETGRDFELGVYTEEDFIIENKIFTLKNKYENDYEGLRDSLGVDDFSFLFRDFQGNVREDYSVERNPYAGVGVVAEEFPVQVIDSQGKIKNYVMNIRIW